MNLTVRQFCIYHRHIKRFEAYDQLRAFEAAAYPYMAKEDRVNLMQKYAQSPSASMLISNPKDVEASWKILRSKYANPRPRRSN